MMLHGRSDCDDMRIMMFAAGGDIGGGKTHILSIAREVARDNELRLICFRDDVMSREAPSMGIDTRTVKSNGNIFEAIKLACNQAKEFRPQLIHCHGAKANMLGALVKRLYGIPVMTTVHSDPNLDYLGSPLRDLIYGNINKLSLRHMDYLVAVADRMRELLIERGFDAQNIFTVYNGLDFSQSSPEARSGKDPGDPIVVGIAARLNPVKDISTLIKGFAKAYSQNNLLRLSIAGSGEEEKALKELALGLGIEDVTRFEGWVEDAKGYFEGVDINVLSSLSETFPYSLLEGAYVHCPAIASNVGGIPYLIEDGKTGLLFEAGDSERLAEHILKLASDPSLRTQLAEALHSKAKEEFSLRRMKLDQEEIYRILIHRSRRRKDGRYGAVLCGAYGKGNAGDDAILHAIISSLRKIDPYMPFYVMSRKPVETGKKEGVGSFYIFNVPRFLKHLRRTKLFVSGGGTLIQDVTSSRSLYFYLFALVAAKRMGCRVVMYGCGIGPIRGNFNRWLTGKVLDATADIITLRDSVSMRLLEDIGVRRPEILLSADPTVSLPPVPEETVRAAFAREGVPESGGKIAFCLREWEGFSNYSPIAEAANYAYNNHGLLPIFLAMEYPKDVAIGEKLGAMLGVPSKVCRERYSAQELRGMLSAMDLVCGMRLHSLIFASSGGSPIVGISYDVKVESFVRDSGLRRCVDLESLTAEELIEYIDEALEGGRSRAEETRLRLRKMENINGEAAERLLGGGKERA